MSETANLPATISQFEEALEIRNPRKRASAVDRIFAGVNLQIQSAKGDYGLAVRSENAARVMAGDAEARHARHARAVELAVRQGDREAAIRQGRERERAAAEAEHAHAQAGYYGELARIQSQRVQDFRDLGTELRVQYDTLEREAFAALLRLRYQQSLGVYREQLAELKAAKAAIGLLHGEADELEAAHSTDPGFDYIGLGLRDRSRRVEEEVDRALRGESG